MGARFRIDYRIRADEDIEDDAGFKLRREMGVYIYGKQRAYVFLAAVKKSMDSYYGAPTPEYALVADIISTDIHETLHNLVRSGGPDQLDREHRAISRLLRWTGWDL